MTEVQMGEIDKEALYGKYQKGQDIELDHTAKRYKLSEEIAAKAADIALTEDEPVNIDVRKGVQGEDLAQIVKSMNQGKQGSSPATPQSTRGRDFMLGAALASAVGMGAAGTTGAGLLGGWLYFNRDQPSGQSPADTEYDVRFYDAEGNLIDVQPITEKANEDSD